MIAETPQIDEPIASRLINFGGSPNARPSTVINTIGRSQLERDAHQADAAQLDDVAEQEPDAEQDDAGLQPELVGVDAGAEDFGHADGVRHDQPEHDRPQHVFDVRQRQLREPGRTRRSTARSPCRPADDGEQQRAGHELRPRRRRTRAAGPARHGRHRVHHGMPATSPVLTRRTASAAASTAHQSREIRHGPPQFPLVQHKRPQKRLLRPTMNCDSSRLGTFDRTFTGAAHRGASTPTTAAATGERHGASWLATAYGVNSGSVRH